ncbi:MAG: amidohydrolase family protein [Acidimicrobiia bacterium]
MALLGGSVENFTRSIEMAGPAKASMHVAHINSTAGRAASAWLDAIAAARASGTFARILGQYVREQQLLTLPDALRRMTIEPARRLETGVPELRDRGRIRPGAYADITIFNPATVIDRATYTNAAVFSEGITHLIVNGTPLVRNGQLDDSGVLQGQRVVLGTRMPGRPIRAARVEVR